MSNRRRHRSVVACDVCGERMRVTDDVGVAVAWVDEETAEWAAVGHAECVRGLAVLVQVRTVEDSDGEWLRRAIEER